MQTISRLRRSGVAVPCDRTIAACTRPIRPVPKIAYRNAVIVLPSARCRRHGSSPDPQAAGDCSRRRRRHIEILGEPGHAIWTEPHRSAARTPPRTVARRPSVDAVVELHASTRR